MLFQRGPTPKDYEEAAARAKERQRVGLTRPGREMSAGSRRVATIGLAILLLAVMIYAVAGLGLLGVGIGVALVIGAVGFWLLIR